MKDRLQTRQLLCLVVERVYTCTLQGDVRLTSTLTFYKRLISVQRKLSLSIDNNIQYLSPKGYKLQDINLGISWCKLVSPNRHLIFSVFSVSHPKTSRLPDSSSHSFVCFFASRWPLVVEIRRTSKREWNGRELTYLVGDWTNPSEKYARQIGSISPRIGMNIKTYLKPPPSNLSVI